MINLPNKQHIVYVASKLPARSETFVYREVLELRRRGMTVSSVSVRAPEADLGSDELAQLASESIEVYSKGIVQLFRDAVVSMSNNPAIGLRVFRMGLRDASFGTGVPFGKRPKLFIQMLAGLALARRLRKNGRTVTHLHAHMAHVPTSIAMYAAAALDVPFSFTGHAADLFRDHSLLAAKIRRAKFVCCISEWHRSFYKSIVSDVDSDRLPVIRCGVDVDDFSPSSCLHNGRKHILAVGRLVEKKGFDLLIQACRELLRKDSKFICTIVGDGPQRMRLEELVRREGVGDFVRLAGSRCNQDVRELMLRSDLFVLPCRQDKSGDRDGIPVVLMEAMACGVPVISGDLVTIRELVQAGKTGEMVEPGSVVDLTEKIERLLEDEELRTHYSVQGRRRVIEEFSLRRNVDRLIELFQDGQLSMTNTAEKRLCQETIV